MTQLLSWFDDNPLRYWLLVVMAFTAATFVGLRPMLQPAWTDSKQSDWKWAWVILALLVIGRWPTWFVPSAFNPDESLFLAGAITLRHDPVFWRSVDTGTAGPLEIYTLLPMGTITGADNYFSARLTACLLIAAALVLLHQTLTRVIGKNCARIALLPLIAFEALTLDANLLHYSSELVPNFLMALALWLFIRNFSSASPKTGLFFGGFALGLVPFAKLQAVLPAISLGLIWVGTEIYRSRREATGGWHRLALLIGGALTPPILWVLYLSGFGLWDFAVRSYLENNLMYVQTGRSAPNQLVSTFLVHGLHYDSLLPALLLGGILWFISSLPLPRSSRSPLTLPLVLALVLLCATFVAIFAPGRAYLHYFQLLLLPWGLLLGCTLGLLVEPSLPQNRPAVGGIICLFLSCNLGAVMSARAGKPAPAEGQLAFQYTLPRSAASQLILQYARPGEALGHWGWMSQYFVETGLRQATRRGDTSTETPEGPNRDFYRRFYLADLQSAKPPVFIDATGPGNFWFSDQTHSFTHNYPELAGYIQAGYVLIHNTPSTRIYVRRDRWQSTQP